MKLSKIHASLLILFLIVIYYLITQQILISQFKSLPSPLYGGDYYFQLGSIIHIIEGGNPLEAHNIKGSEPGYFILYSFLVAFVGKLFLLKPMIAMFVFSQLLVILSLIIFYFFIFYIFRNHWIALLGTIIYLPITKFPILIYNAFTYSLIIPLFFFSIYYFLKNKNTKSGILLGFFIGLMSISHGSAFFVAFFSLFVLFFYLVILQNMYIKNFSIKLKLNKENTFNYLRLFVLIFIIGFSISLLYWYKPIFVYHGKTLNDMQNWAFIDLTNFNYQIEYLFHILQNYFFNFGNIKTFFISIFSFLGVFFIFKNLEDKKSEYILLLLIISFVTTFHYFITEFLLKTHFVPQRISYFTFPLVTILLFCFTIEKFTSIKELKKYKSLIIVSLIFTILLFQHFEFQQKVEKDKWIQVGKQPLSQDMLEMQKWVLNNTNVNDVFLSTNELSFALNALTGRKVMITRRSQNSPFLDIDQREADAAIILYGNNSKKRKELLEKYNISYLYWSNYWIQSEYYFDNQGKITGWFDPILVKDIRSYGAYFENYNISYFTLNTWIDPAIKGDKIRKYNLLFIGPQNYRSFEKPWNKDFDNYLEEIWNYTYRNQIIAKIYRVRL